MKMSKKIKLFCLVALIFSIATVIVYAVGTTRISGQAGPYIDLRAYLAGDLSEIGAPVTVANKTWEYGTGANAVNVIYAGSTTIGDGLNTTLDLYASASLLDIFNRDLTIENLKFLYIHNNSTDANCLALGGDSADIPITGDPNDIVKIRPGGSFLWMDSSAIGVDITTSKNLYLEHDGTGSSSMIVDVIVMGLD